MIVEPATLSKIPDAVEILHPAVANSQQNRRVKLFGDHGGEELAEARLWGSDPSQFQFSMPFFLSQRSWLSRFRRSSAR